MVSAKQDEEDFRLSEQAAEWLFLLEEEDDLQVQEQFRAWLCRSARHVEEFLLVSALYRKLDGVDRARRIDIQQLITEASSNVIPLADMRPVPPASTAISEPVPAARPLSRVRRKWVALVASIAVAVIAIGAWERDNGWQRYATPSDEQRILQLHDGSLLTLNTRSEVAVRFSDGAREVRLLVGNATFKVAHDMARPFRVYAGDSVIQAVGTEFNVLRRTNETRVAVLEGRVHISRQTDGESVAPDRPAWSDPDASLAVPVPVPVAMTSHAQLKAGEEARIDADGEITSAPLGKQRLVFNDERLEDVAEAFNFYNPEVHIRVQDSIAAERRLTGTFNADAPRSLMLVLSAEPSLSVEDRGADLVIRAR